MNETDLIHLGQSVGLAHALYLAPGYIVGRWLLRALLEHTGRKLYDNMESVDPREEAKKRYAKTLRKCSK